MILPMIIPLVYSSVFKRKHLIEIILITLLMILIVIAYWPLTIGFQSAANILPKFILFVFVPLAILFCYWNYKKDGNNHFEKIGITHYNLESSFKLGLIFIPFMIFITFSVKYFTGISSS